MKIFDTLDTTTFLKLRNRTNADNLYRLEMEATWAYLAEVIANPKWKRCPPIPIS